MTYIVDLRGEPCSGYAQSVAVVEVSTGRDVQRRPMVSWEDYWWAFALRDRLNAALGEG